MEAKPGLSHSSTTALLSASLEKVIGEFFIAWPLDLVKGNFFYLFKAVATHPVEQPELPIDELALFLDQLTDLLSAAYELRQASRATGPAKPEGGNHGI